MYSAAGSPLKGLMHYGFVDTWVFKGLLLMLALFAGSARAEPLPLSDNLDLPRFMGRWYVIANIPTPFEKNAYAAVEEYEQVSERKIATRFSYRKGSLDGSLQEMRPTAFVSADNQAVWKMQFIWPFKSDYRVMYVDDNHSVAIVGREKRDYVWLMARTPQMDPQVYQQCVARIAAAGYDLKRLRRVPQPGEVAQQP